MRFQVGWKVNLVEEIPFFICEWSFWCQVLQDVGRTPGFLVLRSFQMVCSK